MAVTREELEMEKLPEEDFRILYKLHLKRDSLMAKLQEVETDLQSMIDHWEIMLGTDQARRELAKTEAVARHYKRMHHKARENTRPRQKNAPKRRPPSRTRQSQLPDTTTPHGRPRSPPPRSRGRPVTLGGKKVSKTSNLVF